MTDLKRNLTLPLLLFYGLGTILGAGIYVLTGVVAEHAGSFTPVSFLIAALVAAPTAWSYARLSSRLPRSAGEAVYVREAFNSETLALLTGMLVVTVGIVSAATIARGFVGYLQVFIELPDALVIIILVVSLTLLAIAGGLESVAVAAVIGLIEIAGLGIIIAGGLLHEASFDIQLVPNLKSASWIGILSGALLAFYAFIGFEDIVNMGEETVKPEKTLPAAILWALGAATMLYFIVAYIAITSVPVDALAGHPAPMALVVEAHGLVSPQAISLISMLAVVNGALVQIIMASRVIFGVARMRSDSHPLAWVHSKTQTPVLATAIVGVIILGLALIFDVERLATSTSLITLAIFFAINLAEFRLEPSTAWLSRLIAVIGALLCLALAGISLI